MIPLTRLKPAGHSHVSIAIASLSRVDLMLTHATQHRDRQPRPTAAAGNTMVRDRDELTDDEATRQDDLALVQRCRAGDRRAFDKIVQRYQRPIYYLAMRYLKNDADAADMVQKTFVRVFKSIARFRGDASFRTWLYRIAINLCLNHIRDHRREQTVEIRDDALTTAPLGASRMIREKEVQRVRDAIEQLPPKQRMVLELRVYDELSFREVAALASCSENAAKVNFHHAVKKLRTLVAEDDAGNAIPGATR
ncbi:MAG: sigma-70 family RNA polymerase sigma factor [Proteobacteria bacterium]|nr:sigma-70 family RNA polymerase sigma factor [Pseudomonadota bacterium]